MYRNLFPSATAIPDSYKQQIDIEIDSIVGGAQPASSDQNPNDNAFGFFILSGMSTLLISPVLHKSLATMLSKTTDMC